MNAQWLEFGRRFLDKYKGELPASCAAGRPEKATYKGGMSFDLHGKAQTGVIA